MKTGRPGDYTSLFAAYRLLAMDVAAQHGIPLQEREEAAQEVDLRFWKRNGLEWYDPNKEFVHKNGTHTAKFGSMYQSWLFLNMLNERDKVRKNASRYFPVTSDLIPDSIEPDILDTIEETDTAQRWAEKAAQSLIDADRNDLVPVLRLCVNAASLNKSVTRADVVEATGCSMRSASMLLKQLREVLSEVGMGANTLHG